MKKYMFILALLSSFSVQAKEYDWTPVFKGWETGCDTGGIMDLGYNPKLEYSKYVEKPIRKKEVEKYEGGKSVYVVDTFKVKQGTYYGMPISEIIIDGYERSEMSSVSFVIDLPIKSVKDILKSKNVKFKKVYSDYLSEMKQVMMSPIKNDKNKTLMLCWFG